MLKKINVRTKSRTEFIDITREIRRIVKESGISDGIVTVFIPHTTAAVTINENADPDVGKDFFKKLNLLVPVEPFFQHSEGNSDSHIKASLMGFSVQVPVRNNSLVLGTWQSVYFCEFDGPRSRRVFITITGE